MFPEVVKGQPAGPHLQNQIVLVSTDCAAKKFLAAQTQHNEFIPASFDFVDVTSGHFKDIYIYNYNGTNKKRCTNMKQLILFLIDFVNME